MQIWSDIKT